MSTLGKVVVLGAGGRLGAALVGEWRAAGEEVLGFTRAEVDLADAAAVESALRAAQPAVVVNCAALTNVDYCEQHPEDAHRVNATAVGTLGRLCTAISARCVHISTDYVFDGQQPAPYTEEDVAEPISHYGACKRAGECALLAAASTHLAVRVSWVFGPDRPSFVDQIVQRARTGEPLSAVADKWSTPTYTLDAARYLRAALLARVPGGILHLANTGSCTWQEYGEFALHCVAEAGAPLSSTSVAPLQMAELKAFIARRPVHTVLSTQKLAAAIGYQPRPWQEAVAEYVQQYLVR